MIKKLKISFNAPATLIFVLLCFIATLLNYLTNGGINRSLFSTYHSSLLSPLTYIRFFTHVFGHSDWGHFASNMSYILILAPLLEEKYQSSIIVFVILFTALVTGLINYFFFPNVVLCGASGVVFALILLASFTSFRQGEIPLTFILVAIIYFGQQIYQAITINDNVSNMAHIVGGCVGSVIGYLMNSEHSKL